jgi:DNA-binding transcriptional MocR family regulator
MWKPSLSSPRSEPLFRALLRAIADDIADGKLVAGERLPPHRELADELGIARGTVARAYDEAAKLGLVKSGVGQGSFVEAVAGGERPYGTLLEPSVVDFDLSTNHSIPGIDPDPRSAFQELADRPDRLWLFRYQPALGALRHRTAGVRWLELLGIEAGVDCVALTAGAQQAIFVVLLHLVRTHKTLYVEELSYPGARGVAEALSMNLVAVEMDSEGMDPDALSRVARRHGPGVVFCMPTIQNPTGAVMSVARRKALASIVEERGLFLIEDEANRPFRRGAPPPIASFAPERTFVVASVSKLLSPGLRVAFVLAPRAEIDALARMNWATSWMPSPLGAEIVAVWIEDGTLAQTLKKKRAEAVERQKLARQILGSGVCAAPDSLHVWLSLKEGALGEITAKAARSKIALAPSTVFWMRERAPPAAVRLALGGVGTRPQLRAGLRLLASILRIG